MPLMYELVGVDPGFTIGVAGLWKDDLEVWTVYEIDKVLCAYASHYGIEDYIPFRRARRSMDVVKQVGVLQYCLRDYDVHILNRATICRTIAGSSSANKDAVRSSLRDLGIWSDGWNRHAVDAVSILLTLGTILSRSGSFTPKSARFEGIFRRLAMRSSESSTA